MNNKEKRENKTESNEDLEKHVYTEAETADFIRGVEKISSFDELSAYLENWK